MADFDLSMVIRAEDQGATATVDKATSSTERLTEAETKATGAADRLARASADEARQLKANADAINQVVRATNPAIGSQAQLEAAVNRVQAAAIRGSVSQETYAKAQEIAARATRENIQWQQRATASAGQMRMGSMMLGQQIQDVGMQLALGTDPMRVFAMQAGQTALAVQQMTGGASRFASFIGGPWGSLILAGVTVAAMLGAELFKNADAAKAAELGANGLSEAQSVLGQMFDLTSGKLERQNELLRINARLQAINLRAEAMAQRASAQETFNRVGQVGGVPGFLARSGPAFWGASALLTSGSTIERARAQRGLLDSVRSGDMTREQALQATERMNFQGLRVSKEELQKAIVDAVSQGAKMATAEAIDKSLDSGNLDPSLRRDKPSSRSRPKRDGTAARDRLEEFGEDAGSRIESLAARFTDTPTQLAAVEAALRQLDDILDDIERRKPPGFEQLLADGEAARAVIEDGINKPYNDFLAAQDEALQVQQLLIAGREDEAEALQIINQLEKQSGDLLPEQREAILAIVQARRAEARELEKVRQQQQKYLDAINDTRDAVRGVFTFGLEGIRDLPGKLFGAFDKLMGDYIFDQLGLNEIFQELEDQATGANVVKDASAVMEKAVNRAAVSIAKLGDAAEGAATGVPSTAQGEATGNEIVVTGTRRAAVRDPAAFFADMVEKLAEGILGREFAATLGKLIGNAFEGAGIGRLVAQVTGGNKTGGMIGGAIGNVLGKEFGGKIGEAIGGKIGGMIGKLGGPLGSVLGSVAGSLLGGLFGGRPKPFGTATVTNTTDQVVGRGSSGSTARGAVGLGTNIQQGLSQIAEALGATVGAFDVMIGTYKDQYRVRTTSSGWNGQGGLNFKGNSGRNLHDFGDDQAAAVAFAISDAIADGALGNLSASVQKALKKYGSDLDRSLREAIKVQELEILLGGVGGQLNKVFADFEKTASERVRLAKEYGLDLVKTEEINAKERADLFKQVMEERTGALRQLLDDMNFGNLAEGTLMDQRTRLIGQATTQREAAERGDEGAATRLADIQRQLVELSREAFGTAGPEYAGDRAAAIEAAERVIALEEQRAREAQDRATAHLTAAQTQVTLQNETNNLLTRILERTPGTGGGGTGPGSAGTPALRPGRLARTVEL